MGVGREGRWQGERGKMNKHCHAVACAVLSSLVFMLPHSLCVSDVEGAEGAVLRAGAAARPITPADSQGRLWQEPYKDLNGNGEYDAPHPAVSERPADHFIDLNGNGKWDGPYLAGFYNRDYNIATEVHDDLWARVLVLQQGRTKIGLVALDLIGYFYEEVEKIRERVHDLGFTRIIIASTHTHGGVDTLGLWGPNIFVDGKDPRMMRHVAAQTEAALREADRRLRPARVTFARTSPPDEFGWLINDFRDPIVIDDEILVMRVDAVQEGTIATVVNWSPHPETMGGTTSRITSDFPHYVREGIEKEVGGIAIYFSGAVGGLLTTLGLEVQDEEGRVLPQRSWEKTERIGGLVARAALASLEKEASLFLTGIEVRSRSIFIPVESTLLLDLLRRGVIQRETYTGGLPDGVEGRDILTEVVVVFFRGQKGVVAGIVTVPGELFPEIAIGGFLGGGEKCFEYTERKWRLDGRGKERIAAAHPDILPEPVIKRHMPGEYHFLFGLANDELGYIVPANDFVPPRNPLRQRLGIDRCGDSDHYEEALSLGQKAAPIIAEAIVGLLRDEEEAQGEEGK